MRTQLNLSYSICCIIMCVSLILSVSGLEEHTVETQSFTIDTATTTQNMTTSNGSQPGTLPVITNITAGKHTYQTPTGFAPIHVKDFMQQHPTIEVISYKAGNTTIGYINFRGGIGENFILFPNATYEIITTQGGSV